MKGVVVQEVEQGAVLVLELADGGFKGTSVAMEAGLDRRSGQMPNPRMIQFYIGQLIKVSAPLFSHQPILPSPACMPIKSSS